MENDTITALRALNDGHEHPEEWLAWFEILAAAGYLVRSEWMDPVPYYVLWNGPGGRQVLAYVKSPAKVEVRRADMEVFISALEREITSEVTRASERSSSAGKEKIDAC